MNKSSILLKSLLTKISPIIQEWVIELENQIYTKDQKIKKIEKENNNLIEAILYFLNSPAGECGAARLQDCPWATKYGADKQKEIIKKQNERINKAIEHIRNNYCELCKECTEDCMGLELKQILK